MNRTAFGFVILASSCLFLSGCNGPKDTCAGSFESYFAKLSATDFKGMYKLLTQEQKQQIRSPERFHRFMLEDYFGAKDFRLRKKELFPSKDVCQVRYVFDYNVKIRGETEKTFKDNVETIVFRKQKDGKWYFEIPGTGRISAF